MRHPWAIVCDFDGTAITEDLGDKVSQRFAGYHVWRQAEDDYKAGSYGFGELISRIFAPITASREEIAGFARAEAVLRPGFERFVAACHATRRPFVLCSAGLDVYIEPVLERLPPELRAHVELQANRATCSPQGLTVDFHGADGAPDDGCGNCGFCKGTVVRGLQAEGHKVLVCGDGTADRCAADAADFVFATGRLVAYCRQKGIAHRRFETFDEVIEAFPT